MFLPQTALNLPSQTNYRSPLIKHLDNEKSGSHRGWRINPHVEMGAAQTNLTSITLWIVTKII